MAVVLGVWLPLDWIPRWHMQGMTLLEKAYAIASSVVFNFALAVVAGTAAAFLAAAVGRLAGMEFRAVFRRGILFSTWLVLFFVASVNLRAILDALLGLPSWAPALFSGAAAAGAFWAALRRISPSNLLALPMALALVLLPASLVLVACEGAYVGRPRPTLAPVAKAGLPNILFITIDTLSARHLTMYGYGRRTSPNLQAFAEGATTLEHFYANGNWTRPGIASLLNGCRPWTHGADLDLPRAKVVEAGNLVRTLARAGYETECVATGFFASPAAQRLQDVFQRPEALDTSLGLSGPLLVRFPSLVSSLTTGPASRLAVLLRALKGVPDRVKPAIRVVQDLLSRPTERPRFVWLHLMPPHAPYLTPSPFIGTFEPSRQARDLRSSSSPQFFRARQDPWFPAVFEGRYDEAVLQMDAGLGQLFTWLKARGQFDRTLVVVTADHGESFGHGYGLHGGPLLPEDVIWIPCLIKLPFQHEARRSGRLLEQADLAPSLLQWLGLPASAELEGQAIDRKPEGLPVYAMNHDLVSGPPTFSVAVRLGTWKYVEHFGTWTLPWPARELYDLARDPGELNNLCQEAPGRAQELRGLILAELDRRHLRPEGAPQAWSNP